MYTSRFTLPFLLTLLCLGSNPSNCQIKNSYIPKPSIVGGNIEESRQGVGALVHAYENTYRDSFCTATLIAPTWALTAAHCLINEETKNVRLMIGMNARDNNNHPQDGILHDVEYFAIHPGYHEYDTWPQFTINDIALVKLKTLIDDVEYYDLNTEDLSIKSLEHTFLYVGFGKSQGNIEGTSGIKRSAAIQVSQWGDGIYSSQYNETGVCIGDSGGPGMRTEDGSETIVGINSSMVPPNNFFETDYCYGSYNHTRVDVHVPWITNCMTNGYNDFSCTACNYFGCHNTTKTCVSTLWCLAPCTSSGTACFNTCLRQASNTALSQIDSLDNCVFTHCGHQKELNSFQDCVAQKCHNSINQCGFTTNEFMDFFCSFYNDESVCIDTLANEQSTSCSAAQVGKQHKDSIGQLLSLVIF